LIKKLLTKEAFFIFISRLKFNGGSISKSSQSTGIKVGFVKKSTKSFSIGQFKISN